MNVQSATFVFKGMNNVVDPVDLKNGESPLAVNVDFTADGVASRAGRSVIAADSSRAIHCHGPFVAESSRPTSYAECGDGRILWTDGRDVGYLIGNESHQLPVTPGLYDNVTWLERMPVPPGDFICWYSGRIWVLRHEEEVDQSWLYYTDPYDLGTVDSGGNWFRFAGRPTMLAKSADGLWVGAGSKVYSLFGPTPEEMVEKITADYPVVAGTAVQFLLDKVLQGKAGAGMGVIFTTTQGICVGALAGNMVNMSQGKIAVSQAERGAAFVRESGGQLHYVVCLHEPGEAFNKFVSPLTQ